VSPVLIEEFVRIVSVGIEVLAVIVIGHGSIVAAYTALLGARRARERPFHYEHVRISLARALVLGLELEVGADLLETVVSPTWYRIGILSAIVVLRIVLNYVLQRDIDHLQSRLESESASNGRTAGQTDMEA